MQPSQHIIDSIKELEGFRAESYDDGAGFQTIGYGHRIQHDESFTVIDKECASRLLTADLKIAADCINSLVKVKLNQNQFDALISFTFNLGCKRLKTSSLLSFLNAGNYVRAANEFSKWVYVDAEKSDGLIKRRAIEEQLFKKAI